MDEEKQDEQPTTTITDLKMNLNEIAEVLGIDKVEFRESYEANKDLWKKNTEAIFRSKYTNLVHDLEGMNLIQVEVGQEGKKTFFDGIETLADFAIDTYSLDHNNLEAIIEYRQKYGLTLNGKKSQTNLLALATTLKNTSGKYKEKYDEMTITLLAKNSINAIYEDYRSTLIETLSEVAGIIIDSAEKIKQFVEVRVVKF